MQQLSGLDASFLYLETPNAPMQIGGVSIVDPRLPDGGTFDFEALRAFMATRLRASRVFRQRLVDVPLDLGKPYWIEDPDFDLDLHLERTQLPEPGGARELAALMSWEFSHVMPRERPLWHLVYVEGVDTIPGVEPGSVALISKIHHAAIDGGSGAEIMGALYDLTPVPRTLPGEDTWRPESEPSVLELARRTGRNLLAQPKMLGSLLGETAKGVARAGATRAFRQVELPPMPFTAPRSILNVPVTKDHVWAGATLGLDRVRALKSRMASAEGGRATVNDVVLAVCAGALRRYLRERDALPEKPLVAMVPISVRAEAEQGAMGNQVSAMLVELATDEADPLARVARIRSVAGRGKVHHEAIGANTLTDYTQVIPFSVAGLAARLYTRTRLAERHRPVFNVVITNVPGPQVPLYVSGARLVRHLGAAPIFDGMGLTLVVFSYAGELTVSATSCRSIMPDIETFAGHLEGALDDLEAAVAATDDEQA